jgi:PAS domain S-box-containing protein
MKIVWSATIATLLAGLVLSGSSVWLFERNRLQNHRQEVIDIASQSSFEIQEHLYRSLSATYALAAVIRQSGGDTANFRQLAHEMLQLYPGVSTLMVAPQGIIAQAVPLEGNERAIGHNILQDNKRNKEALLALHTRSLTLAGPFELVQGGVAMAGRLPVFLTGEGGQQEFWGFSIALIRIPVFMKEVGLRRISANRCNFELSRVNPDSGKREVFYSAGAALHAPITQKIQVPNGEWTLSVEPSAGWHSPGVLLAEVLAVLLFSGSLALAVRRLTLQPVLLQQMVDARTRELSQANRFLQAEIRDRIQAQEALQASEHKLRSICTSLTDVILILDDQGRYLEVPSTNSQALQLSPAELVGKTVHDLYAPEQADFFLSTIRLALAGGQLVAIDYCVKVGERDTWFAGNVSPLSANTVVWSARDITRRKHSEAEQHRLEQQLLHAQKLESLGVLAGGIAHDFNNILMAIIGNADLAQMRVGADSPAAKNLQQIEQAAARAADLTRQMLAYSGRGTFVVQAVSLNHLLEEMLHLLEVSISKKARLKLELADRLPAVEVDVTQMHQIVMNLVINASEAIGDQNGVITVSTGRQEYAGEQLPGGWFNDALKPGSYAFLEVVDTGCGMEQQTLARIFDPFFTTKFTGRGLGMAAVLGIVRGHHGAIQVKSAPGRGSSFRVLLPASGRPLEGCLPDGDREEWLGSGTVLLVDDEETVRSVGSEMLQQLGFDVVSASDGEQALEVLRSTADFELVILDLTMPNLDGEQCFQRLREIRPQARVIMSSGFSEQEIARKFTGSGLAGFIQKPYTLAELREVLRRQLQGAGKG